jgi:hypothetical protein
MSNFYRPCPATDSYGDQHHESYDPNRSPFMLPLANVVSSLLPGLGVPSPAMAGTLRTYAPSPVWRDSTTKTVKFMPLKQKKAVKIFHKARAFERQTRPKGKQDGALGRNGLLVLHALIFDFLNYATGRLDPAIATIAKKAAISISSAKRGLANLKHSGVLHWLRRAAETHDGKGRFCLEQDTNAYGIVPPSHWLGFFDPLPDAPPPHPSEWGAVPPLPPVIEQAAEEIRHGARKTALSILESDPGDETAAALASFGRAMEARPEKGQKSLPNTDSSI